MRVEIELHKEIRSKFLEKVDTDPALRELFDVIQNGKASYIDADECAYRIGTALSEVLGENLAAANLEKGELMRRFSEVVLEPLLEEQCDMVSKAAAQVQKSLNERAGIGLQVEEAPIPADRIDGLVEKVANASSIDEAATLMDEPIKNMAQAVVADTMQRNVAAHGRAGLVPKIKRRSSGKCCDWCDGLVGDYEYPDVPEDVYRRHQRCRCTVDYYPGNGKRQNVWTKEENVVIEAEPEKTKHENVMPSYYRNAKPYEGKVVFDEGLDVNAHDREIKIAEFLHAEFGGDIIVLNESVVEGEKRPDYLWNNQLWDLKTLSSAKAADSALRKGLKQIAGNPGGLILDYGDKNVPFDELLKIIDGRMSRGKYESVDVMIIQHKQVVKILRYKK